MWVTKMKNMLFKDVPYFTTFSLYNQKYQKVTDTKCIWNGKQALCDPDNLVEVEDYVQPRKS